MAVHGEPLDGGSASDGFAVDQHDLVALLRHSGLRKEDMQFRHGIIAELDPCRLKVWDLDLENSVRYPPAGRVRAV